MNRRPSSHRGYRNQSLNEVAVGHLDSQTGKSTILCHTEHLRIRPFHLHSHLAELTIVLASKFD